jgi:hypothetical protein
VIRGTFIHPGWALPISSQKMPKRHKFFSKGRQAANDTASIQICS